MRPSVFAAMGALQYLVEGGTKLAGTIRPSGNKNAALPIIAASLLSDQLVTLENVPRIRDVEILVELVKSVGADVEWAKRNTLKIHAKTVKAAQLDPELCRKIRASILLAAPLLARCGEIELPPPGGDVIGRRRLDTHFLALERLGVAFELEDSFRLSTPELRVADAGIEHLRSTLLGFARLGISCKIEGPDLVVPAEQQRVIQADLGGHVPKLEDQPWPAFPADTMSIALVTATQCTGLVLIHEKMFEPRLFFVDKLVGMGARIVLCDPHRALVSGPSRLRGGAVDSPDIRAGMAMLLAALCADGESTINNVSQIERGYERIDERLRGLGAKIERVEERRGTKG